MTKKNIGLFALSLAGLLASCGENVASSSLPSSESFSNASSSTLESSLESIKGDMSRTYLKNALETSFTKKGAEIAVKNASISESTQNYKYYSLSGKEGNLQPQGNRQTATISNGNIKAVSTGRDASNFDGLNLALSIQNADVTTVDGADKTETKSQSGHFYLKNSVAYWDFLNDNGNRSNELKDAVSSITESLLDLLDYDTTDFSLSDKSKVSLEDEDLGELFDALMPLTTNNTLIPSFAMTFLDKLALQEGAEYVYTGVKDANNNKFYTTKFKISSGETLFNTIYSMVDDLPDVVDSVIEGFDMQDILDGLNEIKPFFTSMEDFKFDLELNYTMFTLTGAKFDFGFKRTDANYLKRIIDLDYDDEIVDIAELSIKGEASFIFDDERKIAFPDLTSYTEFTLPEKNPAE